MDTYQYCPATINSSFELDVVQHIMNNPDTLNHVMNANDDRKKEMIIDISLEVPGACNYSYLMVDGPERISKLLSLRVSDPDLFQTIYVKHGDTWYLNNDYDEYII
jgi:hypothetical protein